MSEGYKWVVDLDLESYFDTVNHDLLIGLVYKEAKDSRVLSFKRKDLQGGVMISGAVRKSQEGIPQGESLSLLLSNIMPDVLNKECEGRNLSS